MHCLWEYRICQRWPGFGDRSGCWCCSRVPSLFSLVFARMREDWRKQAALYGSRGTPWMTFLPSGSSSSFHVLRSPFTRLRSCIDHYCSPLVCCRCREHFASREWPISNYIYNILFMLLGKGQQQRDLVRCSSFVC